MSERLPGDGFLGWLGRQVGYVSKAVKTEVGGSKVVYRESRIEQVPLPGDPNVVLRRTVVDEVIAKEEKKNLAADERR